MFVFFSMYTITRFGIFFYIYTCLFPLYRNNKVLTKQNKQTFFCFNFTNMIFNINVYAEAFTIVSVCDTVSKPLDGSQGPPFTCV